MSTSSLVPTVITREFTQRPFDIQRIENAIAKASASTVPTKLTPAELARKVHREILRLWPTSIYIEEIQDIVERVLMQEGETEVARHYILYRAEHAAQREKRDVPPEVRAAFDESAKYFPTAIQQFQFFDKYSRYDETLGRRETWVETVDRTMSFLRELVSDQVDRTKGSEKPASGLDEQTWHEIRQGILEMRVMPSMRLLAMAGPAARRQNLSLYNCSAVGVDSLDTFVEALLISMAGCGVGFSVERRFVDKLPTIAHSTIAKNEEAVVHYEGASDNWPVYSVEDTTEGWADALRIGLETWFSGQDVSFDFSLVRPAGSVLKTKGGRASGPEPLRKLLQEIRWIIIRRRGQKLRPIDAHDIMCHVGSAAVSGGTRRTAMISLFDHDDYAMLHAKDGDLTKQPQRWNANNSAVWPDRGITQRELLEQMLTMDKAGTGEPGIFNRKALQLTQPKHRETRDFLTNPCGEIVLRPDGGLCNLSICVARPDDTYQTLAEKVRLATIIGTIQSLATKFPGMRPIWRKNAEEERLLGVDITGQRDCEATTDPIVMGALRGVVYDTNLEMAERFGIKQAASTTCVKPSGNSSVLLNSSSGIHARWAPYYVRNVRVGTKSPIYQVLKDAGVPMQPEVGQTAENAITWVASFPVKSPEGAITRSDLSALEQCNYWLHNKKNWTTHNPSVTITYRPDELLDVIAWVWENRNVVGGMSFLPRDDAQYDLMPYQEISKETYEQMMATFPTIDFSKMYRYEQSDTSTASSELSCFAGQCEIA